MCTCREVMLKNLIWFREQIVLRIYQVVPFLKSEEVYLFPHPTSMGIHIKPIPILVSTFIANRYRYICLKLIYLFHIFISVYTDIIPLYLFDTNTKKFKFISNHYRCTFIITIPIHSIIIDYTNIGLTLIWWWRCGIYYL